MVRVFTLKELQRSTNLGTRIRCKACGLYLNQLPAWDEEKTSNVFWVGLSAVQFADDQDRIPLSPSTKSGSLIKDIEEPYKEEISFYKTNIVKCLPLSNDKIRYPSKQEMEKCYPNLEAEIEILKPSLIFLLGKQTGTFLLERFSRKLLSLDDDFHYDSFLINGITYIPIHHPSYILVYKRRNVKDYIRSIQSIFEMSLIPSVTCY